MHRERLLVRGKGLHLGDVAARRHGLEHCFLPGLGERIDDVVRVVNERVVGSRRLWKTRKQCSLGQVEQARRLEEIQLRCTADSDRVVAVENAVDVHVEDLALGEVERDLVAEHDLLDLVVNALGRIRAAVKTDLGELLGDRRTTLQCAALMGGVVEARFHKAGEIPRAFGVEVVILDGDDRLFEVRGHLVEVDVDVAVALVVEDVDQAARRVVDVGIDLGLHVADGRRIGEFALVRVIRSEGRADRAGADRREERDRDEHDPEHAAAFARGAQVAVGSCPPAPQFRLSRSLRGADTGTPRTARAMSTR